MGVCKLYESVLRKFVFMYEQVIASVCLHGVLIYPYLNLFRLY